MFFSDESQVINVTNWIAVLCFFQFVKFSFLLVNNFFNFQD